MVSGMRAGLTESEAAFVLGVRARLDAGKATVPVRDMRFALLIIERLCARG